MGNTLRKGAVGDDEYRAVFTCEICMEPMLLLAAETKKFNNNNKCSHAFCTECMVEYIQMNLEDNVAEIPCPSSKCTQYLDPLSCRPLIGSQRYDQWCDVIRDKDDPCGYHAVKRLTAPGTLLCFECGRPWHEGSSCSDATGPRGRSNNIIAFGRLPKPMVWRSCPDCQTYVQRKHGYSVIYCRCGTRFCYICGVPDCVCLRFNPLDAKVARECGCLCLEVIAITFPLFGALILFIYLYGVVVNKLEKA